MPTKSENRKHGEWIVTLHPRPDGTLAGQPTAAEQRAREQQQEPKRDPQRQEPQEP